VSEVTKESFWRKGEIVVFVKDVVEGMGGLEEEQYAIITSGLSTAVIPCDSLIGGWDEITNDLEPMTWQHVCSISAGNEEETLKLLDLMSLQAMEICSQGAVPFEEIDPDKEGNVKAANTDFGNAAGYWEKAIAQLNSETDDDGNQQIIIQIILYGRIFTGMYQDLELNEENIGDKLTITPQFSNNLGDDDILSAVSFDLRKL
jgi:hypothetical protein